ncbi:hypothetical protein EMCRGX_G008533 [Ephydatia muelleri]
MLMPLSRRRETVGRASHLAATRSTTGVLAEQIRIAQQKDDIIQQVYQALRLSVKQPMGTIWRKSPFSRYHQLWSQLKLREGVVYRTYIPGPSSEAITVPVLPACLRKEYLTLCHDRRSPRECNICQQTKPTAPKRAPLINIPVGRPWQMVAVDILEVPVSSNNNRYILVVFAGYGIPEIIHSDQGRNFESTIFQQTMAAFGVKKSCTTAYHPQGDGMMEWFNHKLLQLLRAYVDQQNEWEKYLPFALYAYRTSTHTSTSVSPFELMFGRQPKDHTEGQTGYAVDEYQGTMQAKLAELMDFVETHMVDAARHQKQEYDKHMGIRTFKAGDLVWLSIPTAGKLDPRWEGGWKVKACKSPVNMEVNDGTRNRVVHVKRLRHRIQMAEGEEVGSTDRTLGEWVPPQTEHITVEGTPPQGPEPDLENNDQPVQPEEPIQRSPSTCGIADWSNHCPRTVGTLHHLRLPRTKGLDVPLWFSTLCHFTFLTAGSVFPSRSFEGRLPPSSLLLKLLHVVFLHLIYAAAPSGAPPLLFMQARHAARSKGSLHPTKNVAGVQNGFISSRMRPRRPPVNPPNGSSHLPPGGFIDGAPRPDACCARLGTGTACSSKVSLADRWLKSVAGASRSRTFLGRK